ncbi:hypothetical protein [Streptomyces sp. NPDC048277]|uniref:hypothetical protein n=1 Tax=Streptomyces sp. NPDC048277 TaxID=3155027 RepID=UPI0033FAF4F7
MSDAAHTAAGTGDGFAPLAGITAVDFGFGELLPGPTLTRNLAELAAHAAKVERPGPRLVDLGMPVLADRAPPPRPGP